MKKLLASFALLGLASLFSGCGDPQSANSSSRTRFVNALIGVPGTGSVNASSSHGGLTASNIPYGGATTYFVGPYGGTDVTYSQTGTATPILTTHVELQPQKDSTLTPGNTVIATGVIGGQGATAPQIFRLTDNFPATSQTTNGISYRIVNLSPDSGPISFYATTNANLPMEPIPGATNIAYGNASSYVTLPFNTTAGQAQGTLFDSEIVDAKTGTKIPTPIYDQGSQSLSDATYTIFVIGLRNPGAGQPAFDAYVVQDK